MFTDGLEELLSRKESSSVRRRSKRTNVMSEVATGDESPAGPSGNKNEEAGKGND